MRRLVPFLAPVLLAGCGAASAAPEGYPIAIADAYQRLAANRLDDLRYHRQCGILIHISPYGSPNQSVTWIVTSSGRELLRFTANLQAVDAGHTKVTLDMPTDASGKEAYSGGQFYPRPAFNQPLRPAIEEQISALLEGREFDMDRMGAPTDGVCNVQRGTLMSSRPLHIDDAPGTDRPSPPPEGWGRRGAGWGR